MIEFIPASACHSEQFGTISVTSLLSYNNYFDPQNAAFGPLLVFNDYIVPPRAGFKMHPHPNCEQLFFMIDGIQKCSDTLGNSLILKPITIQYITAGNGYARETSNYGNTNLRFLSVRFQPRIQHTIPQHKIRTFSASLLKNQTVKILSGNEDDINNNSLMVFDLNAEIFMSIISSENIKLSFLNNTKSLIYIINGQIIINNNTLEINDHLRILGPENITITPVKKTWLLIINMY